MTGTGEGTSLADRKRRAGQRLVIGFAGLTVTPELRELAREVRPAGFILFARNVQDPAQVRDLNRALTELLPTDLPPILSVDQEGGRVQRIRTPATVWPAMRRVGTARDHTADLARALGRELRAMGFNLDYAPVADVDSNPDNPVIGDRSFGTDVAAVSKHLQAFIRALQSTGVMACAKHFPGHGDTFKDSHHDLPVVESSDQALRGTELPPFAAAARAGVGSVMSAHVVYPAWDPDWPATLSEKVLRRLLRQELGYEGLVFTDDLEMKAVSERYTTGEKARRSCLAGVDLALVCHEPLLQLDFYEEFVRLQEQDRVCEGLVRQGERRLAAARAWWATAEPPPALDVVGCDEHQELARQIELHAAVRAALG